MELKRRFNSPTRTSITAHFAGIGSAAEPPPLGTGVARGMMNPLGKGLLSRDHGVAPS